MAGAGPHLLEVIGPERRLGAGQLCERLQGMRLLVLATVTADGRPVTAPVDGYFLHGTFWFSLGAEAVRTRHMRRRPHVSATHLPGESLAVTMHGRAELFDWRDHACAEMRQAMFDHYAPRQGTDFAETVDDLKEMDAVGARLVPERLFTFHMSD